MVCLCPFAGKADFAINRAKEDPKANHGHMVPASALTGPGGGGGAQGGGGAPRGGGH